MAAGRSGKQATGPTAVPWMMDQLKLNKRKLFVISFGQLEQMVIDKFVYLLNEAEAWDAAA